MNAARSNSIEVIEFLIRQKDIDVNATDGIGNTASQLFSYDEIMNLLQGEQF